MMSKADIERIVDEKLVEMRKQMIEELQGQVESEDKSKTIWDLDIEDGEEYYHLYGDGVVAKLSFGNHYDERAREVGNAFLTEEEAIFERERRKIESIMRKYSRPVINDEDNWYIEYNYDDDKIYRYCNWGSSFGISFFESREIAQMVVDEIGRDRLIKYWFGVKDDE